MRKGAEEEVIERIPTAIEGITLVVEAIPDRKVELNRGQTVPMPAYGFFLEADAPGALEDFARSKGKEPADFIVDGRLMLDRITTYAAAPGAFDLSGMVQKMNQNGLGIDEGQLAAVVSRHYQGVLEETPAERPRTGIPRSR